MSRMGDAAKRNERRGQVWLPGGAKPARLKPKEAKANVCSECGVYPCAGRAECRKADASTRRMTIYRCPKCSKVTIRKGKMKRHQKWRKHY